MEDKPASSPMVEEAPQGGEVAVGELEALVGNQPALNDPTTEMQGDEDVHEVVPADEVQHSQVGDQPPPNSMQGDEQVHAVPVDDVKDPPMAAQHASDVTIVIGEDEFWPLSGKPFFDIIIAKSHIRPLYQLVIPPNIHHTLPPCSIPTILKFRDKEWEMVYNGSGQKRIDNWRAFVIDNNLKIGDACVFELQKCSSTRLVFRVQILRGDIPAALLAKIHGETADRPLVL